MRLEGWGGLVVRDALLRSAPHHEAERSFRLLDRLPSRTMTVEVCGAKKQNGRRKAGRFLDSRAGD
jgi:hypothetical protein